MPSLFANKKFLPLIIAGVLGLVATFLINQYIQQQTLAEKRRLIEGQKNVTKVVMAKQDISAGVAITKNMLTEKKIYKNRLQPRAATDIDRVLGKVTLAPISKDEQILLNKLALTGREISLSAKVPRGKRAITIPVDNISSVGGMIRPGDHVDIVGMIPIPAMTAEGKQVTQMSTMPLFQDVLVLAVGQEFTNLPGQTDTKKKVSPVITFALSPEEANLIAFVQEQGRIRLVLRSPEDTQKHVIPPASWDSLMRTVMPQAFDAQDAMMQEDLQPKKTVEIYRGQNKEIKPLE